MAIINIVFKSHYTNHIITRILIQLRLIEVKKKWPEMKTEIDIIKQQVESLRKNERKFSSRINESSETSDVPFECLQMILVLYLLHPLQVRLVM